MALYFFQSALTPVSSQLQGHTAPKTSFSSTVRIKQCGHALLHLEKYNETYLITLPPVHIEGLIYGSPSIELSKTTYIQSSSGFSAKIDYSGRGWLGGKKTSFTASIFPEGREKDSLYTIEGQWAHKFTIKESKTKKIVEIFDGAKYESTPIKLPPLEKQDPLESRRAWYHVTSAILDGNMDLVSREKCKIESQQREMRKWERIEGTEWKPRYFEKVGKDNVVDKLGEKIGWKGDGPRTGCWKMSSETEELMEILPGHP